jgi:hypothetical protein
VARLGLHQKQHDEAKLAAPEHTPPSAPFAVVVAAPAEAVGTETAPPVAAPAFAMKDALVAMSARAKPAAASKDARDASFAALQAVYSIVMSHDFPCLRLCRPSATYLRYI